MLVVIRTRDRTRLAPHKQKILVPPLLTHIIHQTEKSTYPDIFSYTFSATKEKLKKLQNNRH